MIYILLTRRDKKGIKLISSFNGSSRSAIVDNKSTWIVPKRDLQEFDKWIKDHHMLWETRIEEANDYVDLRNKLSQRGFSKLPLAISPTFPGIRIDLRRLSPKKIMIQKFDH